MGGLLWITFLIGSFLAMTYVALRLMTPPCPGDRIPDFHYAFNHLNKNSSILTYRENVQVMQDFDIEKYGGTWYQMFRKQQEGDIDWGDCAFAEYTPYFEPGSFIAKLRVKNTVFPAKD